VVTDKPVAGPNLTGAIAMTLKQSVYSTLVFLFVSLAVCRVQASTAVYDDFQFLSGEFHFNDSFSVTAPGLYEAQLFDFQFPDAFKQLSLVVTQGSSILGGSFATSAFTFNVLDTATPLWVHVSGKGPEVTPGVFGTGLYGMQILPIPIPPAFWLFISGFTGIIGIARRGFRSDVV
jgi:hypothetical protein